MIFYFIDINDTFTNTVQRHIMQPLNDGGVRSFPYSDDNPNKQRVDEWIVEGNELTEWNPEVTQPDMEEGN
jgi:hypothetical protein